MHPRNSWLVIGLLTAFAVQAGAIYKWVDKDGVVHYSDQETEGSEKISISSINSARSLGANPNQARPAQQAPQRHGALAYDQFSINSPAGDQTFFAADVVSVNLSLSPSLQSNHSLTWHLNGKELDTHSTSFSLPQLERGTYALAATITDQQSGESLTSNNVTFFVRTPSALGPQHK